MFIICSIDSSLQKFSLLIFILLCILLLIFKYLKIKSNLKYKAKQEKYVEEYKNNLK